MRNRVHRAVLSLGTRVRTDRRNGIRSGQIEGAHPLLRLSRQQKAVPLSSQGLVPDEGAREPKIGGGRRQTGQVRRDHGGQGPVAFDTVEVLRIEEKGYVRGDADEGGGPGRVQDLPRKSSTTVQAGRNHSDDAPIVRDRGHHRCHGKTRREGIRVLRRSGGRGESVGGVRVAVPADRLRGEQRESRRGSRCRPGGDQNDPEREAGGAVSRRGGQLSRHDRV
mmetsp:Transcript_22294/g.45139  ORF Transcript_22294/g.45139 Transcript_22294/m.45139 type:complete len:222 (-) Transcript_22294:100-765(-)